MAKPYDFGGVNLTAGEDNPGEDSSGARVDPETPFRIAILGDFSGRANRGLCDPATIGKRRAVLVDRDNFDDVLAHSGAEIHLPIGDGGSSKLRFSELDDFHPDRIFEQLEDFYKLRELRGRVQDASTFPAAAEALGLRSPAPEPAQPKSADSSPAPPRVSQIASGSLLDDLVEQTEARGLEDQHRRAPDAVQEFARRVAAEHLVSAPDPRQPEVLGVMDRAIAQLMRAILHNSDFQSLEAAWRATFLLVRLLETGSTLKIYLFDISKEELAADLESRKDFRETGAYRLLVQQSVETPGADPWAIIVGNYSFGADNKNDNKDADFLSRMAQLARRAGAPFLAEASPRLLGCSSLVAENCWRTLSEPPAAFTALRHLPEADALGLALPRFLLRLPYGKQTSPLESFDFEEFPGAPVHEDYLWGNPAFVVALLLAQSFAESKWKMRPGSVSSLTGLPLHLYRHNGDSEVKPCAEVLLIDDAVDCILSAGLMPLVSFKARDEVRLARFQSIADPPHALAGRWMR